MSIDNIGIVFYNVNMKSKTLCVLPWSHVFISSSGWIYPCCVSQDSYDPIRSEKGVKLLAESPNDLLAAWNSTQMKNLRLKMTEGQWPSSCKSCKMQEAAGQTSYRQSMNSKYKEVYEALIIEKENVNPEFLPISLDLRWSNHCNLSCRMCSPWSSKSLQREWESFFKEKLNMNDSFISEEVVAFILKHSSQIQHLRFAGGEPFLTEKLQKFLLNLIALNESKHIGLSFNTNLTLFPEKLIRLFSEFRDVEVSVSLDGYGDLNDYIRYPSRWHQIVENLKMLKALSEEVKSIEIRVQTTVQIYNIMKLDDLIQFLETEFQIIPQLNMLSSPSHLSIQALPSEFKSLVQAELVRLERKYINNRDISALKALLFERDESAEFDKFKAWTKHLDQSRRQNILQHLPFLKDAFL